MRIPRHSIKILLSTAIVMPLIACSPDTGERDHMAAAQQLLVQGSDKEALIELKNALIQDPKNLEARWELGKLYIRIGNSKGAIKELERAQALGIERDAILLPLVRAYLAEKDYRRVLLEISAPDFKQPDQQAAELYNIQGEAYMGEGSNEQAIGAFANALSRDPSSETAQAGLVRAAMDLGDAERASKYLQQLLITAPRSSLAITLKGKLNFRRGQLEQAEKDFKHALELDNSNTVAQLELARTLLFLDQADAAEKHLNAVIARYPGSISGRFLQGWIQFKKGNYPVARTLMEAVLEADPKHDRARLLLAAASLGMKEYESANLHLKKYLSRNPNNPVGLQMQASLLLQQEQPEKAMDILQSAPPGAVQGNSVLLRLAAAATLGSGDEAEAKQLLEQAKAAAETEQRKHLKDLARQAARQQQAGNYGRAAKLLNEIVVSKIGSMSTATRLFDLYLKDNNLRSADELARYLTKRYPEYAQAQTMLGLTSLRLKRPGQARQAFTRALQLDPASLAAALNLAAMRRNAGDLDGAINDYQALLDTHPGDISIYRELYRSELVRNDTAAALSWMEKARQAQPQSWEPYRILAADALKHGDDDKALEILGSAVEQMPDEAAPSSALAELQTATGNLEHALNTATAYADRHPDSADAQVLLGNVASKSNHTSLAHQAFARALTLAPANDGAAIGQFRLQMADKDYQEALATARIFASNNGAAWLALALEGEALMALGENEAAARSLRESLSLSPRSSTTYKLASALASSGDPQAAGTVLAEHLQTNPQDTVGHLLLAALLTEQKNTEAAREQLETVLEHQPNNAVALNDLAVLYRDLDPLKALELARRAHSAAPQNANIMDTLGWLLVQQQQDLPLALELLDKAASAAPDNPTIAYHLAATLAEQGDTEAAIKQLKPLLHDSRQFTAREDAQALLDKLNNSTSP